MPFANRVDAVSYPVFLFERTLSSPASRGGNRRVENGEKEEPRRNQKDYNFTCVEKSKAYCIPRRGRGSVKTRRELGQGKWKTKTQGRGKKKKYPSRRLQTKRWGIKMDHHSIKKFRKHTQGEKKSQERQEGKAATVSSIRGCRSPTKTSNKKGGNSAIYHRGPLYRQRIFSFKLWR